MKKDINIEIGERVKSARKAIGFSKDELAEMLGVSSLFLGYIECGQRGMSLQTLKNMCSILGVSSDYLLFGKKDETPLKNDLIKELQNIDAEYLPLVIENINNIKKIICKTKYKKS